MSHHLSHTGFFWKKLTINKPGFLKKLDLSISQVRKIHATFTLIKQLFQFYPFRKHNKYRITLNINLCSRFSLQYFLPWQTVRFQY